MATTTLSVIYGTGPSTFQATIADSAGTAVDLTTATVTLEIGEKPENDITTEATVSVNGAASGDPTLGIANFTLTAANTVTLGIGTWYAQVKVVDGASTYKGDYFIIKITAAVSNV